MERRLAAILAADVVGYSRLMGADEAGTLSTLKAHRQELMEPEIAAHQGRIVKLMGDGVLAEFASVVDAVECAVALQQGMARRNAGVSQARRIQFRIGVNLGDVIVEGDDLYGDGVNVAARLEGLADPGGICISGPAFDVIEGKLDVAFEDVGERKVKNIAKPLRVYRFVPRADAQAAPAGEWRSVPDKPSIAVLPFTNMSGDPEQDYFADGITEDIITELSRFQSLFVIARNSTFTYKGRAVRVQDVGRELGVHYVLEGSVRRAGGRVRVTVQLVNATNGNHIWAERYDRDVTDIFELQDELTQSIVATLSGRLESADVERVKRKPPNTASVYDYVLRAKLCHHRGTPDDSAEALRLLDQALSIDPEFAPAYAWRACTVGQAFARGYIEQTDAAEREVYRDVLRGLALDENDLECIRILGEFRIEQYRPDDALVQNEKALRLNPNDPRIVAQRGEILTWLGRPEDGAEWVHKAMRLSPYEADAWAHLLGRALFGARRYQEALSAFSRVPRLRYPHHAFRAACHAYLGEEDRAAAEAGEVLRAKADFSSDSFCKTLYYKDDAEREHVRQGLVKAGLPE